MKEEEFANGVPHASLREGTAITVAVVAALENILSNFLFAGMNLSYTRRKDTVSTITKAVRLWSPPYRGEDIPLDICMEPPFAKCILALKKELVKDLRSVLGNFLFEAIRASRRRTQEVEEGKLIYTSAVEVIGDIGDESAESQVRIMMEFSAGMSIWQDAFTTTSLFLTSLKTVSTTVTLSPAISSMSSISALVWKLLPPVARRPVPLFQDIVLL